MNEIVSLIIIGIWGSIILIGLFKIKLKKMSIEIWKPLDTQCIYEEEEEEE